MEFDEIQRWLTNRDYPALAIAFDQLIDTSALPREHFIIHFFALYMSDRLPDAKFLWKSLPERYKVPNARNNELAQVWNIGQSLIKQQYTKVNQFCEFLWSETVQSIAQDFVSDFQFKMRQKIQAAYSRIDTKTAHEILGNTEKVEGWEQEAGFLIPIDNSISVPSNMNENNMRKVTGMVNFLLQN